MSEFVESETNLYRNVSYLNARDPSIQPQLWSRIRVNLQAAGFEGGAGDGAISSDSLQEADEKICVYLRIKKNNLGSRKNEIFTIDDNVLKCKFPAGNHVGRNLRPGQEYTKTFKFSHIFQDNSSQEEIFNHVVRPKLLDFINGKNSTILTYGASGSGKTYTFIGTDKKPGIVPRSLEYLFRTLPKLSETPVAKPLPSENIVPMDFRAWKEEKRMRSYLLSKSQSSLERQHHMKVYKSMQESLSNETAALLDDSTELVSLSVWVSFAEIYNEQIYDLLQPEPTAINKQRTKLGLGRCGNHHYIKNLNAIAVTSGLEAYEILQYGLAKLKYASTKVNDHSSRSHSVFTIKLIQMSQADGQMSMSTFNFCDLAGSERSKKTLNTGDRLKESNNINGSLLVLGRCIKAVRETQKSNDSKLIPFRESKLTQLFQNALSGLEDMSMIVTINPVTDMLNESHHVLNFSAIAKDITISEDSTISSSLSTQRDNLCYTYSEELPQLREKYAELEKQMEQSQVLLEDERERKEYLKKTYENLIEQIKETQAKQVEAVKEVTRLKNERKLEQLQLQYERELERKQSMGMHTITIHDSSSSDDDSAVDSFEVTECQELEEDVERVMEEVEDVAQQCEVWRDRIQEIELKNLQMAERCNDMEIKIDEIRQRLTTSMMKSNSGSPSEAEMEADEH